MEKMLSVEELAELMGVPPGTIYAWNYTGSGPPMIKVGRHARYRPADVDRWLEEKARNSARLRRDARQLVVGGLLGCPDTSHDPNVEVPMVPRAAYRESTKRQKTGLP